jgi:hypothetical protein
MSAFSHDDDDLTRKLMAISLLSGDLLFEPDEKKIPSNLKRNKNGGVSIINSYMDLVTLFKIKDNLRLRLNFNTRFEREDFEFLKNPRNNLKISQTLVDCCNILTNKIEASEATLEECQEIMSSAANQFSSGSSPLHVAAAVGDLPLAHLLVIFGFSLDEENEKGFTPRMMFERIHEIKLFDI